MLNANIAQCTHFKVNGVRCGSPALRGRRFCYFHNAAYRQRQDRFVMPFIEDANSLHLAIQEVLRALAAGHLDTRQACALLYGLQIVHANLSKVHWPQRLTDSDSADSLPLAPADLDCLADLAERAGAVIKSTTAPAPTPPLAPPQPTPTEFSASPSSPAPPTATPPAAQPAASTESDSPPADPLAS